MGRINIQEELTNFRTWSDGITHKLGELVEVVKAPTPRDVQRKRAVLRSRYMALTNQPTALSDNELLCKEVIFSALDIVGNYIYISGPDVSRGTGIGDGTGIAIFPASVGGISPYKLTIPPSPEYRDSYFDLSTIYAITDTSAKFSWTALTFVTPATV